MFLDVEKFIIPVILKIPLEKVFISNVSTPESAEKSILATFRTESDIVSISKAITHSSSGQHFYLFYIPDKVFLVIYCDGFFPAIFETNASKDYIEAAFRYDRLSGVPKTVKNLYNSFSEYVLTK